MQTSFNGQMDSFRESVQYIMDIAAAAMLPITLPREQWSNT